ncbi:MAG: hypothetical protein D6742_11180 [Cyanobacteria bacterium J069]|nr:MAG: hypothetical protein D6742_11180 [Cyanobacteria bacterium J069]
MNYLFELLDQTYSIESIHESHRDRFLYLKILFDTLKVSERRLLSMKSQLNWHRNWHNVETLERIFRRPVKTERTWKAMLNELWQMAIARLDVSGEPHVWQTRNAQGDVLWNAYDPKTGKAVSKASDTDLRTWLEGRYYQTAKRWV